MRRAFNLYPNSTEAPIAGRGRTKGEKLSSPDRERLGSVGILRPLFLCLLTGFLQYAKAFLPFVEPGDVFLLGYLHEAVEGVLD